jgi:hypothetical protein
MSELFAVTLSVVSSLLVGAILAIAPWTALWDANYLLQPYPALRALALNPFARGTISGLGLVNIILALHDAYLHLFSRGPRS